MSARTSRRKRKRGFLGWIGRILLLVLIWLIGVAAYIIWTGQRDDAGPADAIIVLGAAAYDAKPSPVFEERIRHGIDLFHRGLAPKLIFTGGYGGAGARFSESQVARRYALRQGVPENAILIESISRNTHENLRQASTLMQNHNLHSAIIVSDPLHMARALRLSGELGIRAVGSPTPTTRFRSFATRWRFLLAEVYFFHRDRLSRAM
ncbi:YdcF family protein [Pseudoxanthomonas sp. UTMC 1351]|uniref:YdcF family protein n=1 Tax=Pseudoxanthomonas sp. UTMC 1351 TaxID=2695853 RepID=UPI0034CD5469